jgi:ABC-type multidrug transport system fused ATPase/permease subunit
LLTLGYAFTLSQDPSRLVNIVASDVWRATEAVRLLFSIVSAWCAVAVFSVVLLSISVKLFVFVGIGIALIRGIPVIFSARPALTGRISTNDRLACADVTGGLVHAPHQSVWAGEESEHRRFAQASDAVKEAMYSVQRTSARVTPIMEVFQATLFIIVLLAAYFMQMALPTIAAFLILLYRMQPQIVVIGQSRLILASLKSSIAEVEWLLGPEGKPASQVGGRGPTAGQPLSRQRRLLPEPQRDASLRHLSLIEPK